MNICWEMSSWRLEEQFREDHRLTEPVSLIDVECDGYTDTVLFQFEIDDDDVERIRDGQNGNLIMSAD